MMRISAAAVALVFAALSLPASAQTYPPVPQPLVIDKSEVCPGDTVTVQGGGAAAGDSVTITFDTSSVVATVQASPDGTFQATFTIPLDATLGQHEITATSEGRVLGTVTVTVIACETPGETPRVPRPLTTAGGGSLLPFIVIGALVLTGLVSLLIIRSRAARAG